MNLCGTVDQSGVQRGIEDSVPVFFSDIYRRFQCSVSCVQITHNASFKLETANEKHVSYVLLYGGYR